MSGKITGINKKVIIIGCIIEVILIAAILFSIFYEDPTYKSFLSKGQEQLNNKQYEKAIESFGEALKIDPDGVEALVGQADGYTGIKEYNHAISLLEKAKEINNSDSSIYNKLVTCCIQSENIDKANEIIMEIIQTGVPAADITSVQPAPVITPGSGQYKKAMTVTIDGNGEGTLYYTTNGNIPTIHDKKYEKPIKLSKKGKYRITAITIQDNGLIGFAAKNDYTLDIKESSKISFEKYLGTWTDGETTLNITSVEGSKVNFNISLSWVDEVIKTTTSGTVKNGVLNFSYIDNWDNKGTGTMGFNKNSITVIIDETNSDNNDGTGFGHYSAILYKNS